MRSIIAQLTGVEGVQCIARELRIVQPIGVRAVPVLLNFPALGPAPPQAGITGLGVAVATCDLDRLDALHRRQREDLAEPSHLASGLTSWSMPVGDLAALIQPHLIIAHCLNTSSSNCSARRTSTSC